MKNELIGRLTEKEKKEIRTILDDVGLKYATIEYDEEKQTPYIRVLFQTFAYVDGGPNLIKFRLIDAFKDLICLCEDYVDKLSDKSLVADEHGDKCGENTR